MLLFIHGSDVYRAREKVRAIKAQYAKRYPGAFELREFDWSEAFDLEALRNALETGGFFAAHKLVILKNLFQAPAASVAGLHEFLKVSGLKKRKDATLLLWETGAVKKEMLKAESARAALAWLKRNALSEEYAPLAGEAFGRWARRELAARGIALAAKPFTEFCRVFEGDTWRTALEIEKLALGHPFVAHQKHEAKIFDLVAALWRKDQKRALVLLHTLFDQGTKGSEFYILAMMAYAVRKSLERVSPEGYRTGGIRERELDGLKNLHRRIVDADLKIKTGALEPRFALELLTVGLTSR